MQNGCRIRSFSAIAEKVIPTKYFASYSPKGAYFRRDGWSNHYLCGRSPDADEYEPEISNNDVDYEFFEENVWPVIANRAKCFENSKVGY